MDFDDEVESAVPPMMNVPTNFVPLVVAGEMNVAFVKTADEKCQVLEEAPQRRDVVASELYVDYQAPNVGRYAARPVPESFAVEDNVELIVNVEGYAARVDDVNED